MRSFKDRNGREWILEIDVYAARRMRDLAKVDIGTAIGGDLFERLINEPILLVDVLYAICQPQANKDQITDEQFGHALYGRIDEAQAALLEEIGHFFPKHLRGPLWTAARKTAQALTQAAATAVTKIDAMSFDFATNSPASPDSTPGDTPSGN